MLQAALQHQVLPAWKTSFCHLALPPESEEEVGLVLLARQAEAAAVQQASGLLLPPEAVLQKLAAGVLLFAQVLLPPESLQQPQRLGLLSQ